MNSSDATYNHWVGLLTDCPLAGSEASLKIGARGIQQNRYLIGIERSHLEWDRFLVLCESSGLPASHISPLRGAFDDANQLGFGIEIGPPVIYKIYFEFWDRLVRELRANPNQTTPRPLHLGLKWDPVAPEAVSTATYTCLPMLPIPGILQRLQTISAADSASLDAAMQITTRVAPNLPPRDAFIYTEAAEQNSERRSWDLNLYKAGCRVGDVLDLLRSACVAYGLSEQQARTLDEIGDRPLGHIGGGRSRDGEDYFTIYYEIDGLPGRLAAGRPD